MAATVQGARLTEEHRRAQVEVQRSFLAEFLAVWALLDLARLDDTAPAWLSATRSLVALFRQRSADVAVDYHRRLRLVEAPQVEVPMPRLRFEAPPIVEDVARRVARGNRGAVPLRRSSRQVSPIVSWRAADEAAKVSLIVTGPVNVKRRTARGEGVRIVNRGAMVDAAGAAARHVLDGGRRAGLELVKADPAVLGWVRVTDADPCYFCAMLASRGAVYKDEQAAGRRSDVRFAGGGQFKVHDHCACSAAPVFSRTGQLPGQAAEWRRLWRDHIEGNYTGKEAVRAWRNLYEDRVVEATGRDGRSSRRSTTMPGVPDLAVLVAERERELRAEIAALEASFADLQRRKDAGADVAKPYAYQRDRLAKLRDELRRLRQKAA